MTLQQAVNVALENAHDNGYKFDDWTYLQVAEDLVTLDGLDVLATPEELEPLVRKYYAESDITYRPKHN